MVELYRVFGLEKKSLGIVGYLTILVYYIFVFVGSSRYITLMVIMSLMALMSFYVFTYPCYKIDDVAKAYMTVCYAGIMFSFLYQTRCIVNGKYMVWLIFLSAWGSDTCAYCAGMLFGRHKMTPVLSPKKTIEGAIGGIAGAAALGALFAWFLQPGFEGMTNPVFNCSAACTIAALIAIVGDLAASGIKRDYGIKDYSQLIPGHGGIMDRFDSIIFTAPAIFFALTLFR